MPHRLSQTTCEQELVAIYYRLCLCWCCYKSYSILYLSQLCWNSLWFDQDAINITEALGFYIHQLYKNVQICSCIHWLRFKVDRSRYCLYPFNFNVVATHRLRAHLNNFVLVWHLSKIDGYIPLKMLMMLDNQSQCPHWITMMLDHPLYPHCRLCSV